MKTRKIAIIGLLSALNIASRIILKVLPNIKPVTPIIFITSMIMGAEYGIPISIVTTIVSGFFLGLGTYIPFQILAFCIIALVGASIGKLFKKPNLIIMALLCGFMGFLYGFFVSLDKLFIAGPYAFLVYYGQGLSFDFLHAIGNIAFYIVLYPVLAPILRKEKDKIS